METVKNVTDPYGEENWSDVKESPKKKIEWFPIVVLCVICTILVFLVTTCAVHDELKYTNIKKIEVKMVVTNEIFRDEREGKQDVTNFYLRVESPFMKTPDPDYLLRSKDYPTARVKDTLVCLVEYSTTLRKEWYSNLARLTENPIQAENKLLFNIVGLSRIIKPK